ncbi:MAG: SprB repeat-containing protein [Chitinophagaceae bacterium]
MKKNQLFCTVLILLFSAIIFNACSKGSSTAAPADPCTGVTVVVTLSPAPTDAGSSNGSITATATGGTGFTFSLNNGTFQASGVFNNLAAGKYAITAKNANGCSSSASSTVVAKAIACAGQTPGPFFTAVKAILTTNCAVTGCHNGTQSPDYRVDCTIVDYADLIKLRAVDQASTADQMPQPPRMPLVQADRDKINAWIAAGKRITD